MDSDGFLLGEDSFGSSGKWEVVWGKASSKQGLGSGKWSGDLSDWGQQREGGAGGMQI